MNILVTGGAGYIGSVCVENLINQKHSVIVIDNLQKGHRESVLPEAIFYEGDSGDKALLRQIFNDHAIDAVIHFAADSLVGLSVTDPQQYFKNNVVNGINLLEIMKEHGCKRIIFSSTAATFGEPEYTPIDEKHPQKPINPYGESKLMFEKILDWYHSAYDFRFNSFRYFNAAGASERLGEDHNPETHLIPLVLQKALEVSKQHEASGKYVNGTLNVFGSDYPTKDGTCIRDYIHVVDLAQAHILALENLDSRPNAKYNLGNGKGFSVLEVIETSKKVTGVDIPYRISDRRSGDPATLIASSDLAVKELGIKPEFPELETIIETAWKWKLKNPEGY